MPGALLDGAQLQNAAWPSAQLQKARGEKLVMRFAKMPHADLSEALGWARRGDGKDGIGWVMGHMR